MGRFQTLERRLPSQARNMPNKRKISWPICLVLASVVVLLANYVGNGPAIRTLMSQLIPIASLGINIPLLAMSKSLAGKNAFGGFSLADVLIFVLFVWWLVGSCHLTFSGPFKVASNGYFGSWGAMIAAAYWFLGENARALKGGPLVGTCCAAIVLMVTIWR